MSTRITVRAVAALAVLAAVAGCSSAGPAPGRSGGSTLAAPGTTSAPAAPATSSSASASTTAAVPTATASAPASTPNLTATAPAGTGTTGPPVTSGGPRSTCTKLVIRVIRGSAAPGFEYAALQFVNAGTSRCVLNGYPSVRLLLRGATVGPASTPAGRAGSRFVLAPGATAESRLRDFSSCQAPLSDEIRVVAPGSSISLTRPAQLRACTSRVSALTTPE